MSARTPASLIRRLGRAFTCNPKLDGLNSRECARVLELMMRAAVRAGLGPGQSGPLIGEIARLPCLQAMPAPRAERLLIEARQRLLSSLLLGEPGPKSGPVLPAAAAHEVLKSLARVLLRSAPPESFPAALQGACGELDLPPACGFQALEAAKREFEFYER